MTGLIRVRISPELIANALKQGNIIPSTEVVKGLPDDAKFIGGTWLTFSRDFQLTFRSDMLEEDLEDPIVIELKTL